ncbi:DHA2 family efflux MFS transporter permease subunit [Solirubrobacter sp. CPCC 204708]|uniref:DHA2 family efflux MFS transporter permease subunit n=1 Tax=Solirubrobacter deserti TaxID=2282478 RepID=A0ABT4RU10_9ACTN|nr:DHA2 family efflux MFS transporter permease subunit [Solirubrobacter deserti]MBE2315692.1 DHA2 family efflux MFS transporter permease subunit [Solirubrobacter deserti]MDA0141730.1 DHA2 family efflux MFS transporter permease subunit [Solirubrobacter deserti]
MSTRDQRLTLTAATLGSFVALLDSTVVGVALPAIGADLGGGLESQQWIVNAYLLALGSLILIGGSLGDVFGERRVFVSGTAGFGIASAACAAAPTAATLIAARGLQGVFAALLTPASLAVIVAAFAPEERGRAIGTWTAFSGIAAVVGPLAGGWLVDSLSWRWIFGIVLPFVALTLVLATRMPARAPGGAGRRPDWLGAGLCAFGLAGVSFGLVRQPGHGWADALVTGPLVAGAVLLALFVAWERRGARDPMLPLGLFRRPNFAWGNLETFCVYGALGLLFFVLVVFLQQVAGYSALKAGAATIPTTLVMLLFSQRFGVLADRFGPRRFMAAGPVIAAAGVAYLLAAVDRSPDLVVDVLPGMTLFAFGLATLVTPLTTAVLADADEHNAGIASGVNNAVARVAGLLATAAVGTIVGGTLDLTGLRTALVAAGALLLLGGLTGLWGIRDPTSSPAATVRPGARSEARAEC